MRFVMRKPRKLKVICYAACMIELNKYLAVCSGTNANDKIGEMEMNEMILNIIPNVWIRQAYVQGFDCEYIP